MFGSDSKMYLYKVMSLVNSQLGTDDLEWFCASQTLVNLLFNIKSAHSYHYAKLMVEQLIKKVYAMPSDEIQDSQDHDAIIVVDDE